jgi:hypothetical protein
VFVVPHIIINHHAVMNDKHAPQPACHCVLQVHSIPHDGPLCWIHLQALDALLLPFGWQLRTTTLYAADQFLHML